MRDHCWVETSEVPTGCCDSAPACLSRDGIGSRTPSAFPLPSSLGPEEEADLLPRHVGARPAKHGPSSTSGRGERDLILSETCIPLDEENAVQDLPHPAGRGFHQAGVGTRTGSFLSFFTGQGESTGPLLQQHVGASFYTRDSFGRDRRDQVPHGRGWTRFIRNDLGLDRWEAERDADWPYFSLPRKMALTRKAQQTVFSLLDRGENHFEDKQGGHN